jgi:hypothetical protein
MVESFKQASSLIIIRLLLLPYVAKGLSSLNLREKWKFRIEFSNLARVNLTHMLGTSNNCSKATVCLSFRLVDQCHHKRLQDHTHIKCAGRMPVAQLHDRTPVCYAERTPARWCVCEKPNYEWWGVCPLLGPIGY